MKKKVLKSKINDHKREKKELVPPFSSLGMSQIYWHREMLPEFLWIDSLVSLYGEHTTVGLYNKLLDVLDEHNSKKDWLLLGTVSSFSQIKKSARDNIVKENRVLIDEAVVKPFGLVASLYSEIPMQWLIGKKSKIKKEEALKELRNAIKRLFLAKDSHGGFCRAIPLNKFFKHNKLFLTKNMTDTIKAIEEYPYGDRYRAESFARNVINMDFMKRKDEDPNFLNWSEYFWKHNFDLTDCI